MLGLSHANRLSPRIESAVAPLWEPATHCANVRGAVPATVLPTPCTSLVLSSLKAPRATWARPSGVVRTLTRSRPPPAGPSEHRHVKRRRRYPLQRPPFRPLELPGHRRDLRKVKDDTQDDCTPGASLSGVAQCTFYSIRPLHAPDSGKNDDFSPPPVHVLRASLCL